MTQTRGCKKWREAPADDDACWSLSSSSYPRKPPPASSTPSLALGFIFGREGRLNVPGRPMHANMSARELATRASRHSNPRIRGCSAGGQRKRLNLTMPRARVHRICRERLINRALSPYLARGGKIGRAISGASSA